MSYVLISKSRYSFAHNLVITVNYVAHSDVSYRFNGEIDNLVLESVDNVMNTRYIITLLAKQVFCQSGQNLASFVSARDAKQ